MKSKRFSWNRRDFHETRTWERWKRTRGFPTHERLIKILDACVWRFVYVFDDFCVFVCFCVLLMIFAILTWQDKNTTLWQQLQQTWCLTSWQSFPIDFMRAIQFLASQHFYFVQHVSLYKQLDLSTFENFCTPTATFLSTSAQCTSWGANRTQGAVCECTGWLSEDLGILGTLVCGVRHEDS